ncbi:hypothetical protein ACNAN0_02545 [Agrilactobacillus fermenti]|uniref:hypothetical protein n=1 Tax=Agrilactobacillus fermenti TaxID=2586909 RepID=UPI001E43EA54|nr:hypothetical protein [Agrilactobacillus fermenti]MCD2256404.1 hypothetical protein [Agrilactobacillus fermenti]
MNENYIENDIVSYAVGDLSAQIGQQSITLAKFKHDNDRLRKENEELKKKLENGGKTHVKND